MRCRFLLLSLFISLQLSSQPFEYHKYWVQFTDKSNNPYSLIQPEDFLSPGAIERRTRQHIEIDSLDLPVTPAYVDSIKKSGIRILNKSKWLNGVTIETTDSAALLHLLTFPFVAAIEPVAARPVEDTAIIGKEKFGKEESIVYQDASKHNAEKYGRAFHQIQMLNGDYLHSAGYRGEGMIIAVLDAGFRNVDINIGFDSLWLNDQIPGAKDFVDFDDGIYSESTHGASVLSIMAGNIPGEYIGTAPGAQYLLLRTEDTGSEYRIEEYNWLSAAEYADSTGADIINSSLGYSDFTDTSMNYSYADMDGETAIITQAAKLAARKGMLVVTSAGNQGNTFWKYITAPADADSVISVGAVDSLREYTSFSSIGPTADGRVKPNVVSQGRGTIFLSSNGDPVAGGGTSFAAPIIAGLVACFWQAHPEKSVQEIISLVEKSASLYAWPHDSLGYGLPDFKEAHLRLLEEKGPMYVRENLPLVYPNPFHTTLNVMLFAEQEGQHYIEVFDAMGQRIHREEKWLDKDIFWSSDLSHLAYVQRGVYFVRTRFPHESVVIRALKMD